MTTHSIDFSEKFTGTTQHTTFKEIALPIGADIVEIDIAAGGVRLAAIAFHTNFDDDGGNLPKVYGYVPWKSGGAWLEITTITAVACADETLVVIPYAEIYPFEKIRLDLTTQTTATKIGIFGWTG